MKDLCHGHAIILLHPTLSSCFFVCAADKQNLARDSTMPVAGKPTTTPAMPLLSNSRLRALIDEKKQEIIIW